MAIDKSCDVRRALLSHGAEFKKLTAAFTNRNNFVHYTGMSDDLKRKLFIRGDIFLDFDCLIV